MNGLARDVGFVRALKHRVQESCSAEPSLHRPPRAAHAICISVKLCATSLTDNVPRMLYKHESVVH